MLPPSRPKLSTSNPCGEQLGRSDSRNLARPYLQTKEVLRILLCKSRVYWGLLRHFAFGSPETVLGRQRSERGLADACFNGFVVQVSDGIYVGLRAFRGLGLHGLRRCCIAPERICKSFLSQSFMGEGLKKTPDASKSCSGSCLVCLLIRDSQRSLSRSTSSL